MVSSCLSCRYAYAMLAASEVSAASVVIRYVIPDFSSDMDTDLVQLLAEPNPRRSVDYYRSRRDCRTQCLRSELVRRVRILVRQYQGRRHHWAYYLGYCSLFRGWTEP